MSADIAIRLSGTEYRELVKVIESVAVERQARLDSVRGRMDEVRDDPSWWTNSPGSVPAKTPTPEELAEYERLDGEARELDAFFKAKKAFFS